LKINREDMVQAALIVERYCLTHNNGKCDCPLKSLHEGCMVVSHGSPSFWELEKYLRKRGLENAD